jgi:DNA-binding transcriptional MerR regulator
MENYSIGQASKLTGLSAKTIRFYEESGIITPASRRDNLYRSYSRSAIEELKVIKYAKDLGLPLSEIKKLMIGCEGGNCQHSKEYLETIISNYRERVKKQIRQFKILEEKLTELKKSLKESAFICNDKNEFCCNIFHQIAEKEINKKYIKREPPSLKLWQPKGGEKNGVS